MELDKIVRLAPATWPGKPLEVQPGDLSRLAPQGLGLSGPFPIRPWDDPFGPSPAGYYAFQGRTGQPYVDAPISEPGGGVVYFDGTPLREDFRALLRLLDVRWAETEFAAFLADADDMLEQRFASHMRIALPFALGGIFGAPTGGEAEDLLRQQVTVEDALWAFIESEQERWGTGMGGGLRCKMGGDGDWAKESLCFGFMVENGYQGVYRIWSRAWLVTK